MNNTNRSTEEIGIMILELSEITRHKLEDQELQIENDVIEIQRIRTLVHDKNSRIEQLESQLATEKGARKSAERNEEVSTMFFLGMAIFAIINTGFIAANYFS